MTQIEFILARRRDGYSCAAIAAALVLAGLTEVEYSRQYIHRMIAKEDPTLKGGVVTKLGNKRQIRRDEVVSERDR